MAAPPDRAAPTLPRERLVPLDIVRGFALFGILVINIRYFTMPLGQLNNPAWPGGELQPLNFWAWFTTNLLVEDKMFALFSTLFGAGILLMADRGLWTHYRRMFWLLVIGAVHAFLLWFGDILMTYALCGMIVGPLRKLPASLLILLGTVLILVWSGLRPAPALYDVLVPPVSSEARAATAEASATETSPPSLRERRREAFRRLFGREQEIRTESTFGEHFAWRAELNLWWHFVSAPFDALWRVCGFMLLGMGLMATGFLTGRLSARTYLALGAPLLLFGLALTLLGMFPQLSRVLERNQGLSQTGHRYLFLLGAALRFLGVGLTAIGIAGMLLWFCKARWVRILLHPVSAVGRMALTAYLAQSVVCVVMFSAWAMGRWGTYDYITQQRLVGMILAVQLVLCPVWLLVFRFGPMEWLWRTLTYWKLQPLLRRAKGQDYLGANRHADV